MKHTVIGSIMFLLVASIWAGTFIDDFEDGDLDGWRQVNPPAPMLWEIIDGELECTRHNAESTMLVTGEDDWSDYTIEYDVVLLEDFGSGDVDVVVRYTDPVWSSQMLFYFGDFFGAREVCIRRDPGGADTRKPFDRLKLDEWYHIKLEAEGDHFSLWLDDEKVLDHTDKAVKSGGAGLGLANYTAHFDNVIITGPDVPDIVPLTWKGQTVEPKDRITTTWAALKKALSLTQDPFDSL
jgi:hypothetical protein